MSHFHTLPDHTVWPKPSACRKIEHVLRYGTPTKEQQMLAASIVAAYSHLAYCTARRRGEVVRWMRAAEKTGNSSFRHQEPK